MKRTDAVTIIKENWRDLITDITSPAKTKVNGETSYICPECGHGKGGDGLTFDPKSKDRTTLKCFGCGFSGSIIDLYMQHKGVDDFNQATDDLAEKLHITIDDGRSTQRIQAERKQPAADYTEYYRQCAARLKDEETGKAARAYINHRGISTKTAIAAGIGFDPAADPANAPGINNNKTYQEPRIIAPCDKQFYIGRAIDSKAALRIAYPKGGKAAIFNGNAIYKSNVVFIVEGLFDALTIMQEGQEAIALNSKGNGRLLIERLLNKPAETRFIISFDNEDKPDEDKKTRKQEQQLKADLTAIGYKAIIYNIAGEQHDINDALQADRQALIDNINAALAEVNRDDLADFLEKIQTDIYRPHKTGVNFVDHLLNGGPESQTLNLIAAAPGTGKTTLCSQIAESIARNGRPVIYFSFEMSREQMLSKVISARLKKNRGYIKTAAEIRRGYNWSDADRQAITAEVEAYRKESRPQYIDATTVKPELEAMRKYLYIAAEKAIEQGKPAPAVFVDYLHLISGGGDDLAENIKKICITLKTYAIKYDTFVFAILAINRESMKDGKITLYSGRDSSNIEYSADSFISLNYEPIDNGTIKITNLEAMEDYRANNSKWAMILRSLKDRSGGQAKAQTVIFEPAANTFYATENTATQTVFI